MEVLETLQSVQRLSERVIRVLGQNPGKMTLQGTNTYLIGRRPPFILLDTGEGREEYVPVLRSALSDLVVPKEPLVSDIIISHDHFDHHGGLNHVLVLLRQLWDEKNVTFPYVPPKVHKFSGSVDDRLQNQLSNMREGVVTRASNSTVLHDIMDKQIFECPETTLEVLHTPGHTGDSICMLLKQERSLFTADTVLGAGTAVFSDLSQYIASLRMLVGREAEYSIVYPGHGPVVNEGPEKIKEYIQHRLEREEQVVKVMSSEPPNSQGWTVMDIVAVIYAAYPENLWEYAAHGIRLHLNKLEVDGRVETLGIVDGHQTWRLKKSKL